MPDKRNQQPNSENLWVEALKTVGLSVFLAFGVRTGIAQSFFIDSGSMEPTLQVDDRLVVDKVSYRFKDPQRGDVIVFSPPNAATAECGLPQASQDPFIKRVIGLPGEKMEVKGQRVYVNDRPLRENYIAGTQDQWGPVTVPPNAYLVLGDNRSGSCDSRYWGFVSRDRIVGQAVVRFWPLHRLGGITEETR